MAAAWAVDSMLPPPPPPPKVVVVVQVLAVDRVVDPLRGSVGSVSLVAILEVMEWWGGDSFVLEDMSGGGSISVVVVLLWMGGSLDAA